jgi:hypothetical protein
MYRKTRGAASKASATRARSVPSSLGVHPRMAHHVDVTAEASRVSLISKLQVGRTESTEENITPTQQDATKLDATRRTKT